MALGKRVIYAWKRLRMSRRKLMLISVALITAFVVSGVLLFEKNAGSTLVPPVLSKPSTVSHLTRETENLLVNDVAPASASGNTSRIHFITVQTGPSPTWCRMLLSAALTDSSITVVNLAWGARYAHIKRPQWILQYLSDLPPTDVVLFADGGDTIYTGIPAANIHKRFSDSTSASADAFSHEQVARGLQLSPVLFNAEANCYHQQTFQGSWGSKKGKCLSAYKRYDPNITSKYRFLNGGGWIARVWAARQVFQAAVDIIKKDSHWWCDQSVFGGLLLSGTLRGILGLDTSNKFFLPTYHLRPQRDFCSRTSTASDGGLPESLRMCHSAEIPSVLHFNGKSEGKFTADVMIRTSWSAYLKSDRDRSEALSKARATHTILASGLSSQRAVIGNVCPSLTLPV
jgi:hypothetical protein